MLLLVRCRFGGLVMSASRRILLRLLGATLGLFAGLLAGSIAWPLLFDHSWRLATFVFFAAAVLGLLLGVAWGDRRVRHPRPRREVDPDQYPNRMIRR